MVPRLSLQQWRRAWAHGKARSRARWRFSTRGGFRDRLAELVAIRSTSQEPGHEADVRRYLDEAIRPWLERMGFAVAVHANPAPASARS